MVRLPSIGVVTAITNPLTTDYLAYLAFVESWAKVADQVILVDGGSADQSLAFLQEWTGRRDNVHVIGNELTYWGVGDQWHACQLVVNINIGLAALDTDWAFSLGADHVLDLRTAENLRGELAMLSDVAIATCHRGKPGANKINHRIDTRSVAINLRLLDSLGMEPVFGLNLDKDQASDFPLSATRKSYFEDPDTRVCRPIYAGHWIPIDGKGRVSAELISYGHFFFTLDVCLEKVRRWDRAFARFDGRAPRRDLELLFRGRLHSIVGFRSKDEIMAWDHPPEILRVIDEFYEPGMFGGWIRPLSPARQRAARALRKLLGAERHLRTRWMRARGYRGLKELHKWVPLDAQDPEPLDVHAAYMEQDRYLPARYRIDWRQSVPPLGPEES